MFADSVCDSPWANRSHRGWTTLASFGLQALAVGFLLLLPLLYTEGISRLQSLTQDLVAPAPPLALPPPPTNVRQARPLASNLLSDGRIIAPKSIPTHTEQVVDTVPPPPVDIGQLGVPNGIGDRFARNGVPFGIGNSVGPVAPPPPPKPTTNPPRISRMMEGNLIHRVQPQYPALAIMARVQGEVVLRAVIGKDGAIENVQAVSGSPLLLHAAVDAVSQWRYRPYYLNGEPVEVDTQVTVNFVLSGR